MWTALVLVCAMSGPCDRAHAVASAEPPEPAPSAAQCMLAGQATAARSPLLVARDGERIVVKCSSGRRAAQGGSE